MSAWKPWRRTETPTKYLGIVEALDTDVRRARLHDGDRIPPQREIAAALGVDLTTVTRAFKEARRRGLIEARPGRGTFISAVPISQPVRGQKPQVDLSMNIPPQPADAALHKLIPETIADLLATPGGMLHLQYHETQGSEPDRIAATEWLSKRIGGALAPDQVIISGGAQSALSGILESQFASGDTVALGSSAYPGLIAAATQKGQRLAAVSVDEKGLIPQSFEEVCERFGPKALYVTPSIDNPTTAVLPESRRHDIVAIGLVRVH